MKIHRTYLLFGLIMAFCLSAEPIAAQAEKKTHVLNWGIKAGLNAPVSIDYEPMYDDTLMEGGSITNKVGYTVSIFSRINLDEFFFQPELSWNVYKQQLSFIVPRLGADTGIATSLDMKYYSANLSMLAGYNIIHNGPYIFSALLGAAFRFNYETDFKFDPQSDFNTHKPDYNYLGIAAVSFVIDKVFFEFRYEFNFPNSNVSFSEISGADESIKSVALRKKDNMLSFSCGLIF